MNETSDLARAIHQAIRDAVGYIPSPVAIGRVAQVQEVIDPGTGRATDISSMFVTLPSGRTECEWLGSVAAEVVARQPVSVVGRDVAVLLVNGRAIVTGIIWTGA